MQPCSNDFFRFGQKITPKILKQLGISNFEESRTDAGYIIKIMIDIKVIHDLMSYFSLYLISKSLEDEMPITPNHFLPEKNYVHIKIIDFSSDKWKNVFYLKELRKQKLNKIKECQKYL